nr:Clathrin coatomer adaptor and Transthyretin domain containing protein [Haemonchus contortus]
MKRDKKDEESSGNPFAHLDKTSVLQEARAFNETPINARKCSIILTKLLYLIQQGETIGRTEATEAFFAVTKLWQSKDANLRRLVYLAVKDLSGIADDVIIVTSSLTKNQTRVLNTVIEVWDKDSAIIPLLNFLNPDDKAGFTVVDNENGIFKVEGCAADYDLLGPLLPPNRPDFYFHVRHMCDSDKIEEVNIFPPEVIFAPRTMDYYSALQWNQIYLVCSWNSRNQGSVTGNFAATLKFNVNDVDPTTGKTGTPTKIFEELELAVGDLVAPIVKQNFMDLNTLSEAIKKVSELIVAP